MRRWVLVLMVAGCGPGSSSEDDDGGGTGGSADTSATGLDGTGVQSTAVETTTAEGSGGTTGADPDTGSGTTSGGQEDACILAVRLDTCCTQAYPATPEEVDATACAVRWPLDPNLPSELLDECAAQQPKWCQVVDCGYADPPTEDLGLSEKGECFYDCPEDTSLAYIEPGCGEPPPIVHCLPPPPPCADEYCSCEGATIIGCGAVGEPFEHMGPC